MKKKYYSCYPAEESANKVELIDWCEEVFGPKHTAPDEVSWMVTSRYEERPIPLNPFQFSTCKEDYMTLFVLRWGRG